jgi:hypothetical protein
VVGKGLPVSSMVDILSCMKGLRSMLASVDVRETSVGGVLATTSCPIGDEHSRDIESGRERGESNSSIPVESKADRKRNKCKVGMGKNEVGKCI